MALDPTTPAKSRFYRIRTRFDKAQIIAGDLAQNSVQISDQPFVAKRLTWQIVGYNGIVDPSVGVANLLGALQQDGQFALELKADNQVFADLAIPLIATTGGGSLGQSWLDLPAPIILLPKQTLSARVYSTINRDFGPVILDFVLHGEEPDTRAEVR